MKAVTDACEALDQDLWEASEQCEAVRHEINDFCTYVSSLPLAMVKLRLKAIAYQIMVCAWSLREHHDSEGLVFVMMTQTALGVHWSATKYSNEDKEWFKARGSLIVSPEAVSEVTDQLVEQLESGQWTGAVDWINRYESSLIFDAAKSG